MARIDDPLTGLPLGDPDADALGAGVPCASDSIAAARASMIVSASGWRKIFAADGDESSAASEVGPADRELTALAGAAFCEYFAARLAPSQRSVVLAVDSRPTGTVLGEILLRVLLAHDLEVRYLFISPIPEVIAYAASDARIGAFLYVSASHNPVGHNGLKFGRAGEGVLAGPESREVAAAFDRLCEDESARRRLADTVRGVSTRAIARAFTDVAVVKPRAVSAYRSFVLEVADGPAGPGTASAAISTGAEASGGGILIDFNGSARTTSADVSLFDGPRYTRADTQRRAPGDRPSDPSRGPRPR